MEFQNSVSDNGTNFRFVQPLLGRQVEINDHSIKEYCTTNGIDWHFIPSYSPWQGGVYERMIGIVKSTLLRVLGSKVVNSTTLNTALIQVEDYVNSRPLTYSSRDEILEILTPNSFLRPTSLTGNVEIDIDISTTPSSTANLLAGYKVLRNLNERFHSLFYSRYLPLLHPARKHKAPKGAVSFSPDIGDMVLIRDSNTLSRAKWPLGIIEILDRRKVQASVRIINCTATQKMTHSERDSPNSLFKKS